MTWHAMSETILGRSPNRKAFQAGRPFRVSVFRVRGKRTFYTDPVYSRPKASVLYRVIVKPKEVYNAIAR